MSEEIVRNVKKHKIKRVVKSEAQKALEEELARKLLGVEAEPKEEENEVPVDYKHENNVNSHFIIPSVESKNRQPKKNEAERIAKNLERDDLLTFTAVYNAKDEDSQEKYHSDSSCHAKSPQNEEEKPKFEFTSTPIVASSADLKANEKADGCCTIF